MTDATCTVKVSLFMNQNAQISCRLCWRERGAELDTDVVLGLPDITEFSLKAWSHLKFICTSL